jgi:hypothetical protein
MAWTALLNVRAWLLIALIAVSTFAVYQHNVIKRVQAEAALATLKLDNAVQATDKAKHIIKSLEDERDAFVLKRATEKKQADKMVAESQAKAERVAMALDDARRVLRGLSLTADCRTVMAAPICKSVTDELHAPP